MEYWIGVLILVGVLYPRVMLKVNTKHDKAINDYVCEHYPKLWNNAHHNAMKMGDVTKYLPQVLQQKWQQQEFSESDEELKALFEIKKQAMSKVESLGIALLIVWVALSGIFI